MKLKELFTDDDAVSPVIGVILMVAITVILAAVIASFVLGVGQEAPQETPQASFAFEFTDSDADDEGYVKISHDGGDPLEARELFIRGENVKTSWDSEDDRSGSDFSMTAASGDTVDKSWDESTDHAPDSQLTAGDFVYLAASSDYDLTIIWEPTEGDTSATLGSDTGPDA